MIKLIEEIHQDLIEKGNWDDDKWAVTRLFSIMTNMIGVVDAYMDERMANPVKFNQHKELDEEAVYQTYMARTFESEMAQVAIDLFDTARGLGVNLDYHIKERMKHNKANG